MTASIARALSALIAGAPRTALPPSAFVGFAARRLARARVVWVNWPLLRAWGIDVPDGRLTPELERVLLDHFAWTVPVAEGPGRTRHVGPVKRFYADRYAGLGVGVNEGSGRAGAAGRIQIKGIGVTPLAHPQSDYEHRHGGLYLEEAMREAVWSELDHLELPYGANRVLAIIDAMAVVAMPDGRRKRRGLVVRPFPVRPAHYIVSLHHAMAPRAFRDRQRTIVDALPNRRRTTAARRLRAGLLAVVDRLAAQHAALMVQRIPHGGLSASNVELSGQLLDFGSQTAKPGHGNTLVLRDTPYTSNAHGYLIETLRSLATSVSLGVSPELARAVPDPARLSDRFLLTHAQELYAGLIRLCGFPQFVLRHEIETASYWKLARALEALAFVPTRPTLLERRVPRWVGDVDVGAVLYALACLRRRGPRHAAARLRDPRLVPLIDAYFELRDALDAHATSPELDDLVIRLASVRNESRPSLYHRRMRRTNVTMLHAYAASGDAAPIAERIEHLIEDNRRVFDDTAGRCVLREWHDRATSTRVRYAYFPRRGYALEIAIPRGARSLFGWPLAGDGVLVETAGQAQLVHGRLWLRPDVHRVRVGGVPLALLPRVYFDGVTELARHTTLARPIAPPRRR